nr:MAG TPA: hypothetical protein [Caudoviricetes sp.]
MQCQNGCCFYCCFYYHFDDANVQTLFVLHK